MTAGARPGPRLLVVLGPTGTGKSELALQLARRLGGEIVGCDALQVYRGLDAATGKPPPAARAAVAHHLIDWIDPSTDCTMADWVRAAEAAIAQIAARGRLPLVVGGTGLYVRALLRGFIGAPARDPQLRARLRRIVERGGALRLHGWLARRDPSSARRIPAADRQRLIRAVELAMGAGPSWSERLQDQGSWSRGVETHRSVKLGLDLDRERHAALLDARVASFFDAGLVDEVRGLLERGVPATANAFKAIGYREVLRALSAGEDPDGVREEVQRSTRRYAKRQRAWFRGEPGVVWLDAAEPRDLLVRQALRAWVGDGPDARA